MADAQDASATVDVPEERTSTWRVLKRDENTVESVTRWVELEPLTGTGKYGYWPNATKLGALHGEGDYLLLETRDGGKRLGFGSVMTMTVVSERRYYERDDNDMDEPTRDVS